MAKARKRTAAYRAGDVTLGWREGRYVADIRDERSGKRQRIRLDAGLSEADARKAIDGLAESRRLIQQNQAQHTCATLWDWWLADRAKDGFDNTIYAYNWKALGATFGHRIWNLLSADDFRTYANDRFNLGRAPQTVHTELARLRQCFQWALKRRFIGYVPDVWTPSRGPGRKITITVAQAQRLMDEAGDPHIRLFIILALATGARHSAILDLTWDRVDFERGTIQYDEQEDPNPMHKNWKKGRATVPMGRMVREALEIAYSGRQTKHVIEHGARRLKSVRDGFANAVWRAGLDLKVTPHVLRHSVATWRRESGDDFHRIASLLGHQDSRTTELNYTHADPVKYLTSTVDAIDAEFAALPANEAKPRRKGTRRGAKVARLVPLGQVD